MFSPERKVHQRRQELAASPEVDVFRKIIDEAEKVTIDKEVDRNQKGELLTEDRKHVSQLQNELYWKIIRTPSFKQWFGGSVVRDENGEPKVVYRSSIKRGLDFVDGTKFSTNAQAWQQDHFGTFFTSNRQRSIDFYRTMYKDETSDSYQDYQEEDATSEHSQTIKNEREEFLEAHEEQITTWAAFIKLENPYIEQGWWEISKQDQDLLSISDFRVRFIKGGDAFLEDLRRNHDGLHLPHSRDFGDEYGVIRNENIFILPSDTSEGAKENMKQE